MKKLLRKIVFIVSLVGFSSCINEPLINNTIDIVKSPNVFVYSGEHVFTEHIQTRSANVNGNLWYQDWDTPTNVTDEEINKVLEVVKDPIYKINDIKIDWTNYWVQQVYKGKTTYTDGSGSSGILGSDKMNHLLAYNENVSNYYWDSDRGDWGENVYPYHYEHINNFNSGNNTTTYTDEQSGYVYKGTTLMTNMDSENIDAQHQFAYHNSVDSKNHFEYIIIEIDGSYYVCFDFYATHPKGQDANKNMDVERDFIYNDWIVKISPAYPKGQTPEVKIPENPNVPILKDEVEINLLGDNKNEEYLESHLSIHVRAATDVEVFIPVPVMYYCDADDMDIVEKHIEDLMLHGGPIKTEYTIAGNIVTLSIEFVEGGILVRTDGINEEVINYCSLTYQDGITFEVWNYFNDNITYDLLKEYLNKATVEFLDYLPSVYINAFNEIDGIINKDDCAVNIIEYQSGRYPSYITGEHLNGSHFNKIYFKR